MTDSNYSSAELEVDLDEADYIADAANNAADEYERALEAQEAAQSQLQQQEQVSKEVQDDPRNAENWGAKALIKEGTIYIVWRTSRHCIIACHIPRTYSRCVVWRDAKAKARDW